MADSGYLRVEWTNLCYTDWFSNKYTISHDTWYSSVVGIDKKWYFWIDENDYLRIYYIDENWVKRRTDVAESLWNVGSDSKWYIWVWNDSYLYFIWPTWWKMRITGTVTPIVVDEYLYFDYGGWDYSQITLTYNWNNPTISLEISYDKNSWSDYTIWDTITLYAWDRVYWRNKSTIQTTFSSSSQAYYQFVDGGTSPTVWWNANYLLCKNGTNDLTASWPYCFYGLFKDWWMTWWPTLPATTITEGCYMNMFKSSFITETPALPAMTLEDNCYSFMFYDCVNLFKSTRLPATTLAPSCYESMFAESYINDLPTLPATILPDRCYASMFQGCWRISLSETQDSYYQTPYRIPTTWTWTIGTNSLENMFYWSWWEFDGTPNINQTYYTSNTII